ncbi:CubicO group peptidase (beta-lactamase class C family) [Kibdelosporangium banguiense]|uniref:CubicO group peptidase (Beta-lactamase class C family) n=1 Tax=Kibdelosporangium banguiense TaxID=1365924 RepID=A0ABS4TSN9_9PSEU|nr:serine hydrolase [Kibdelosporangium banguiense]MBP2327426.1 CubicO group peptidase (beta-lactamase class C family) [Kibdelosporangium banguiense]
MSQRVFRPSRAAVSALAVSLALAAAVPAAASGTDIQRAQLQELTRKLVDAGAPGVIVRVDDGRGRPIEIAEQAAWTRPDHVIRPGDEYRVASSTKTMMATLVLQLVASGELALTDSVDKWLPGKVCGLGP